MKYLMLAVLLAGTFFLGWSCCRQYKADQGFVQGENGEEWRLSRLQTLGLAGDYVAVYRKVDE